MMPEALGRFELPTCGLGIGSRVLALRGISNLGHKQRG